MLTNCKFVVFFAVIIVLKAQIPQRKICRGLYQLIWLNNQHFQGSPGASGPRGRTGAKGNQVKYIIANSDEHGILSTENALYNSIISHA